MRSNVQFILPGYVHSSLGLASVTQCHLGCWIDFVRVDGRVSGPFDVQG